MVEEQKRNIEDNVDTFSNKPYTAVKTRSKKGLNIIPGIKTQAERKKENIQRALRSEKPISKVKETQANNTP